MLHLVNVSFLPVHALAEVGRALGAPILGCVVGAVVLHAIIEAWLDRPVAGTGPHHPLDQVKKLVAAGDFMVMKGRALDLLVPPLTYAAASASSLRQSRC